MMHVLRRVRVGTRLGFAFGILTALLILGTRT
jgi:hypothetical protein